MGAGDGKDRREADAVCSARGAGAGTPTPVDCACVRNQERIWREWCHGRHPLVAQLGDALVAQIGARREAPNEAIGGRLALGVEPPELLDGGDVRAVDKVEGTLRGADAVGVEPHLDRWQ